MKIELPAPVASLAEQRAASAGFASVAEYVVDLVRQDCVSQTGDDGLSVLRHAMVDEGQDPSSIQPDDVEGRAQQIEAKLLEALKDGPATPMTSANWDELRRRVSSRKNK